MVHSPIQDVKSAEMEASELHDGFGRREDSVVVENNALSRVLAECNTELQISSENTELETNYKLYIQSKIFQVCLLLLLWLCKPKMGFGLTFPLLCLPSSLFLLQV